MGSTSHCWWNTNTASTASLGNGHNLCRASCATYSCPATHVAITLPAWTLCAGHQCNDDDTSTCCEARAPCSSASGLRLGDSDCINLSLTSKEAENACSYASATVMSVCPVTTHILKSEAQDILCAGAQCTSADMDACCELSDRRFTSPIGDVSGCADDDACLQDKPNWGSSYTCSGSTQWCSSYANDMACCPVSCSTCLDLELSDQEKDTLRSETQSIMAEAFVHSLRGAGAYTENEIKRWSSEGDGGDVMPAYGHTFVVPNLAGQEVCTLKRGYSPVVGSDHSAKMYVFVKIACSDDHTNYVSRKRIIRAWKFDCSALSSFRQQTLCGACYQYNHKDSCAVISNYAWEELELDDADRAGAAIQ